MFYHLVPINVILKKQHLQLVSSTCIIMEVLYNNLSVTSKYFTKIDIFSYTFTIHSAFWQYQFIFSWIQLLDVLMVPAYIITSIRDILLKFTVTNCVHNYNSLSLSLNNPFNKNLVINYYSLHKHAHILFFSASVNTIITSHS